MTGILGRINTQFEYSSLVTASVWQYTTCFGREGTLASQSINMERPSEDNTAKSRDVTQILLTFVCFYADKWVSTLPFLVNNNLVDTLRVIELHASTLTIHQQCGLFRTTFKSRTRRSASAWDRRIRPSTSPLWWVGSFFFSFKYMLSRCFLGPLCE